MAPFELICVGRLVKETIYFPAGVQGPVLGSPPAYCSVAAARQGARVGICTKIGPDMPQGLLEALRVSGVDMQGVIIGERTTISELIYDQAGCKEIRYPASSDPIGPEDIPQAYEGCSMLYICPMDQDVLVEDIASVARKGQLSAVDLGGYGGVHMSKAHRAALVSPAAVARQVARHFHVVKASSEDVTAIFGSTDVERASEELLACGPDVVLVTLGAQGALVRTQKGTQFVSPAPCRPIDTTGGGDAFMAGFLVEYLRSGDALRAAKWGCATAACVIEQSGGVKIERMPTYEMAKARFERAYSYY